MYAMTAIARRQTRQETERDARAPWIAAVWAALILMAAAAGLLAHFMPSDEAMATSHAQASAPPAPAATPAPPQTP